MAPHSDFFTKSACMGRTATHPRAPLRCAQLLRCPGHYTGHPPCFSDWPVVRSFHKYQQGSARGIPKTDRPQKNPSCDGVGRAGELRVHASKLSREHLEAGPLGRAKGASVSGVKHGYLLCGLGPGWVLDGTSASTNRNHRVKNMLRTHVWDGYTSWYSKH